MKYLLFIIFLSMNWVFAEDLRNVKVISVHDGDTFKIDIPGEAAVFGKGISVRVYGIDTPELASKKICERALALRATALTQKLVNGSKMINLLNVRRDKYFRLLADVEIDGVLLRSSLLKAGLGSEYYGAKKRIWCEK